MAIEVSELLRSAPGLVFILDAVCIDFIGIGRVAKPK
jgi:hypothetical protein